MTITIHEAEDDTAAFVRVLRIRHGSQQYLGLSVEEADEE